MKELFLKIHKEGFRWNDIIIFPYICAFLLIEFGALLGAIPFYIFAGDPTNYGPLTSTLSLYVPFIGIWAVTLFWFLITKTNRPMFKAIWTKVKGNTIPMFLIGLLVGSGLNGLCALGAYLHKDIHLYYDSFHPIVLFIILITVLIQSSAEELICRGFLYQRLRRSFKNPWVAIIGNSIFFGLIHLGNNSVTWLAILDICLSGLLFSLMVYYYDSIWCAFAAHTAWNYMQNIILGLPNSGSVASYSIFKLEAAKNSFFYDVGFGVEGTVFSVIVLAIACVVTFYFGNKKQERDTDIWPREEAPAPVAEPQIQNNEQ